MGEGKYGNMKKKKLGQVTLLSNDGFIYVLFWDTLWLKYKKQLEDIQQRETFLCVNGLIKKDTRKNMNQLFVNVYSKVMEL
jgi:hypothetical protein